MLTLTVMPPRASTRVWKPAQVDQHVVVDLSPNASPTDSFRASAPRLSVGPRMSFGTLAGTLLVHRVQEVLGVLAVAVGEAVRVVAVQRRVSGNGILAVLRGRLNRVVLPVLVSMLARMIVSVRVPTRPRPASPPSSRMFSRGFVSHGSGSGPARSRRRRLHLERWVGWPTWSASRS